jgi:eukaryotic-like serine/threonine-protein kinase
VTQGPASIEDESSRGDPALIGRTVAGKYKIEKFLGGGAMGAVYKARQSALEKNVAVKVMHRAIAVDPNFVGRFHREAKAASRLDHPNSMRVIDFGEEPDGLLYIAMEYVEGRDLYRVIHEDWPISNADLSDILMQALAAIAVAHEMGVIHRDLKPENLMILRAKNDEEKDAYLVKVCDFGIAKITEKDEEPGDGGPKPGQKLTTQGLVVGTPEYMSPEQARGEKLDARSDIYSMGIILYQLLTGRTPFTADTALAVVLKHITEPPQAPSVHYAGVHKGLEAVCLRALAKDRNERFQTARAMRNAIRESLDGRPMPALDPAAPTAAELAPPTFGGPLAPGTVPIVITTGTASYAGAKSGPMVAAVESAPTVAGGITASHLTPLGTVAAPPDSRRASASPKSRVGLVVAVAAAALLVGFGVLAGPRLLEKSRGGNVHDDLRPPPSAQVTATPVSSVAIPVTAPRPTITAEPPSSVPNDPKGPKRNATAPPSTHGPAVVKTAEPPPAVATTPPAPEPTPPPVVVAPPPTPPPVVPPTPPPAPAFNAASCRATAGAPRGNGSTTSRDITLNGTAAAWTQCAQNALKERPAGPISGLVHIMFSDNRSFRGATCPSCPPPIGACIASKTGSTVSVNFRGEVTGEPAFDVPITIVCE